MKTIRLIILLIISTNSIYAAMSTGSSIERHRYWLNIYGTNNTAFQMLVGYVENATNNIDYGYDGEVFSNSSLQLYSVIEDRPFVIQGRSLPFSNTDEVELGMQTSTAGNFTVTLDHFDDFFANQAIYLVDTYQNNFQNLQSGNYEFYSNSGTFNDRFKIVYLPLQNLSQSDIKEFEGKIKFFNRTNELEIQANNHIIKSIDVYDINGRLLKTISSKYNRIILEKTDLNTKIVLLNIHLVNNLIVRKKYLM